MVRIVETHANELADIADAGAETRGVGDDGQLGYDNRLPAAPDYALRDEVIYRDRGFYLGPSFELVGKRYAPLHQWSSTSGTPG